MNLIYDNAVRSLGEALRNDARVLDMKKKEALMMESEEVYHLSKRMELASEEYAKAISLNDESLIKEKRKVLHKLKEELDMHPLVREYSEAYIKVRDLYMLIDDIIFSPYRSKTISRGNDYD